MISNRTPSKLSTVHENGNDRRMTRTPLATIDTNIVVNLLHSGHLSSKTPYKPQRIDGSNRKHNDKEEQRVAKRRNTTPKSSTHTKKILKSKNTPQTSSSPNNTNNKSLQIKLESPHHSKQQIFDSMGEIHLLSLTIPANDSLHTYESDDETFDFFTDESIQETIENTHNGVDRCQQLQEQSFTAGKQSTITSCYSIQQWEETLCHKFASWLNQLFYPEEESYTKLVMSDDHIITEWNMAKELFHSTNMQSIRHAIMKEVKEGRLAIVPPRTDRFVLNEVHVQEKLTKLLLSYKPRWLQLGLGIVLAWNADDQSMKTNQCMTKESLKKIIKERVLTEPKAVQKYTGGKCKTPSGIFEECLRATVYQHALSQIMILIYFLDMAKTMCILSDDPCLFEVSSTMKSSKAVLLSLFQDCFLKQGSILNHFYFEGILRVSHVQTPLDEYDFHVKNIAVDLKDGVRLARMIDDVTSNRANNLLSRMRLPPSTRERKVHNVDWVLAALRHLGVPHISEITTSHIVAAYRPRIIQLIWSIILHFDLPQFKLEIKNYNASRLIQSCARRYLRMRSYRLAYHGIIMLQSVCRSFQVRTTQRRRRDAAVLIQSIARGRYAKRNFNVKLLSIIAIQQIYRHRLAKRTRAGTAIQKVWRGSICKLRFTSIKTDILLIQTVIRRFLSKVRTSNLLQRKKIASTTIQRVWRGYHGRIKFGSDLLDIMLVQSICRRFIAIHQTKLKSVVLNNAAIDIQRLWRGYNALKLYGFDLLDIITVQSVCRRFIDKRKSMKIRACRKIQSSVRMWAVKRNYSIRNGDINTIEAQVRRLSAPRHTHDIGTSIIHAQRVCRGWLCRKQYRMILSQIPSKPAEIDEVRDFFKHERACADKSFGECDSAFTPEAIESTSNLSCSLSDDGEEIYFTSRHAPKKQRFCDVKKICKVVDTELKGVTKQSDIFSRVDRFVGEQLHDFALISAKEKVKSNTRNEISSASREQPGDNTLTVQQKQVEALSLIQARWRRAIASRFYVRNRKVKYWAAYDSKAVEGAFLHLKKEVASILIQSRWRQAIASQGYLRKKNALIICQRNVRNWVSRRTMDQSVQQIVKVVPCKNSTNHLAAIHRSESFAATLVQKVWRGYRGCADFKLLRMAVIKIQSFVRTILASTKYCRMVIIRNSSIIIQVGVRGFLAKLKSKRTNVAVSILQRAARGFLTRKTEHFSATQIQRVWRGYTRNVMFIISVISAIKIQALLRGDAARNKTNYLRAILCAERRSCAATEIQRCWRGYRTNVEFVFAIFSVIKIQVFVRSVLARQRVFILHQSIRTIQKVWRAFMAKKNAQFAVAERKSRINEENARVKTEYLAATSIQRMWRGYHANIDFMFAVMSVIKIQSFARYVLAKIRVNNRKTMFRDITERKSQEGLDRRTWKEVGYELSNRFSPILFSSSSPNPEAMRSVEKFVDRRQKFIPAFRSPELGMRTIAAMQIVLNSKNMDEILKAVADMVEITKLSQNDCQFLMSKGVNLKLISILSRCNRSMLHLEIVRLLLAVLTNLADYPTILPWLANEIAVEVIADVVQLFRDKTTIFALASCLLERILLFDKVLVTKFCTPENKRRLYGIIVLCKKDLVQQGDAWKAMRCLENIHRILNVCCKRR